ncbi:MAG: transglutaminase-like domain-containing protein [Planctomycetaceae bacterium]|jgi:hypothetical protein|nr:transglutaminase-like domain-containing protein [Planctomycetaceae bacterium]
MRKFGSPFPAGGNANPPITTAPATFNSIAIDAVGIMENKFDWKYSVSPSITDALLCSTSHVGYNTWNTRQCSEADFTKNHLAYACENAKNATTTTNAANKTATSVDSNPGHASPMDTDRNAWRFYAKNKSGDCGTLASLAGACLKLLGIDANAPLYAYPTTDNPVTSSSCHAQVTDDYDWIHDDSNGGKHTKTIKLKLIYPGNNYEAFFTINDPGIKAFTVYPPDGPFTANISNYNNNYLAVLRSVASTQQWVVKGVSVPLPPNHDPDLPAPSPTSEACCNQTLSPGTFIKNGPSVP